MRKSLVIAAVAAGLLGLPTLAVAQERIGDAALGAVSGALVGGPVGAVAGGVVGYTAGPRIARGLGLKGHRHYRHSRYVHSNRSRAVR